MVEQVSIKARAPGYLANDFGECVTSALADKSVIEIMLNPDGKLWLERLGGEMTCVGEIDSLTAEAIIRQVAGYHGKEVRRDKPLLEAELPGCGSRFAAQFPPVVSAPAFAIRKHAVKVIPLEEYVEAEVLTIDQYEILLAAVESHKNILVIGGTGSGKTTLINAIIGVMVRFKPDERIVILEDTKEIKCSAVNQVQYRTYPPIVTMTDLLATTLRMRPDRILVGEVRGPEALDLLKAWNTGHSGGAATLHANSAVDGLSRLELLVSENRNAPRQIERLIADAVHLAVYVERTPEGRRVREIGEVRGYENGRYVVHNL